MKPIEKLIEAIKEWIDQKPWEYAEVVKIIKGNE